jgi:hypothetical protein
LEFHHSRAFEMVDHRLFKPSSTASISSHSSYAILPSINETFAISKLPFFARAAIALSSFQLIAISILELAILLLNVKSVNVVGGWPVELLTDSRAQTVYHALFIAGIVGN